jgi:succinate dehydrogenase flavin-adding protein (antitoxin of CptAB toxin-antitoxin module)
MLHVVQFLNSHVQEVILDATREFSQFLNSHDQVTLYHLVSIQKQKRP